MGDYNPHRPRILGNEWAPIKNQPITVSTDRETGSLFTLSAAAPVVSGGLHTAGEITTQERAITVNVYPGARIGSVSGPVSQVIVPVNGGTLIGTASLGNAATVAEALADPNDLGTVFLPADALFDENSVDAYLAFDSFPELSGKRILDLTVLYSLARGSDPPVQEFLASSPQADLGTVSLRKGTGFESLRNVGDAVPDDLLITVRSLSMGHVDPFHNVFLLETDPASVQTNYPWIYPNLQLFEPSTSSGVRMALTITNARLPPQISSWTTHLRYLALRVTYCEETRSATGTLIGFGLQRDRLFPLRAAPNLAAGPINLAAGEHAVTVSESPGGEGDAATLGQPVLLNAVRQLDPLRSHPGIIIDRTATAGQEFVTAGTDQMVQVTLHTASAVVTGCHVYGTQIAAPVHDATTATQEVDRAAAPAQATVYPQARYYARRFGRTQVGLTLTGLDQTPPPIARIEPSVFDALPELVDGWREVTLRFDSPTPSFAGPSGVVRWQWSATGLPAADRWEVLAADAPAPTGGPGNLDPATYLAPEGGSANLTWRGVNDPSADATLLFAQDPPLVTGFGIQTLTQTVTGIGQDCGTNPTCIPTGISYHRLSWPAVAGTACDTFTRSVSNGWGTATSGQAWTTVGGSASDYSVDGARGVVLLPTGDTFARTVLLPDSYTDVDIRTTVRVSAVATGAGLNGYIRGRHVDGANYYRLWLACDTGGNVDLAIQRVVGGASTTLISAANMVTYSAGSDIHARFQAFGSTLRGKVWTGGLEPDAWTLTVTDTTYTSGQVGTRSVQSTNNTNVNPTISYDNFAVTPLDLAGAGVEVQRFDSVDGVWRTVMRSSDLCPVLFDDYEARVGVESRYRVRVCDTLGFCGLWSAEVTSVLPAPGITAAGGSVLIFTSNVCPGRNLAYVMGFDGSPAEGFTFPEADQVALQAMYRRDFAAAFHGTERGGERFSRTILVQAAAIPPPSLGNFRSLRDLAWADLPYVCVRDEAGNRWLAAIRVPDGVVRRNRRLYLARIDVAEVTVIPAPVDPGSVSCP